MPHTRSGSKRLRQNKARRVRNRATKKTIKTQIKTVVDAASGSVEALREQFRLAVKKLDKAAAKRVIHPNMAARKKSQLAKLLHKKTQGGSPPPSGK
jgi:small subunit ribosomal protein S20